MKLSSYFFLMISILLLSCNKDDEQLPLSFLDGTYEWANENTETNRWFVSQYVFNPDGTYESYGYLRATESGDNIGFTNISKGNYTLRGNFFSVQETEGFNVDYEQFPEGFVESIAELTKRNQTQFPESKGTLEQLEGGNKISILFPCNDTFSSSNCIGALEYTKVD